MSPLYTYECPKGHMFDELGGFDATTKPCPIFTRNGETVTGSIQPGDVTCNETAKRIPSVPAPAQFNCEMPTYQKPKK